MEWGTVDGVGGDDIDDWRPRCRDYPGSGSCFESWFVSFVKSDFVETDHVGGWVTFAIY